VVRRLRPGDEDTLVALAAAYERPIPGEGDVLRDERAHVLAAFREDRPVGYALVYVFARIDGRKMAFLYDVGVEEAFRRQGVAREVLEAAKDTMREAGAYKMFVLTEEDNEAAMALYAAAGGERGNPEVVWTWEA
jgi:ribosomal protein S18 acetylase RimI-like enzyme